MNHPDAVIAAVKAVQSGKMSREELAGLGDDSAVDGLVKTNWQQPEATRHTPPIDLQRMQSNNWKDVVSKTGSGVSHSPSSLDFGDVKDGDKPSIDLALTAPGDGPVTATVPSSSKFTVESVRALSGEPDKDSHASIAPAICGSAQAKAGQSVRVRVGLDSNVSMGAHKATLSVKGDGWKLDVPVSVNMVAPGKVSVEVDEYEHWTLPGNNFDVGVILKNKGPQTKITFSPKSLPNRIYLNPTSFNLAKNANQYEKLHFLVATGLKEGENQSIKLTAQAFNGDQKSTVSTSVSVYDPTTIAEGKTVLTGHDGTRFKVSWYACVHSDGRYHWACDLTPEKHDVLITTYGAVFKVPGTNVTLQQNKIIQDGTPMLFLGVDGREPAIVGVYNDLARKNLSFHITFSYNHDM